MPPERTKELVDQLRTWYRAGTTRQMDLASALGLSRQSLAEILSGRNGLTGEQAIAINSFLSDKHMNTKADYRAHLERINKKHEAHKDPLTLNEAWEQIDELHARLYPDAEPLKYEDYPKPLKAAQEMAAELDAQLKAQSVATSTPAGAIAITPALTEPTDTPAIERPAVRQTELKTRMAEFRPPAQPLTEPDTNIMTIAELRCALQNEKDVHLQSVYYQELKRREPLTANGRSSNAPSGTTLVSTAELEQLQCSVEKSRSLHGGKREQVGVSNLKQSLAAKASLPDAGSLAFIVRPETPLTEIDQLRVELNAEKDSAKRTALYKRIKTLENDAKLSNSRARLRGA
jgi:plasmid maintenance system antidote protein VapI